ncbi:MAG: AraC family transcriptional [Prolixibacteraceae bacterium]|nr:MAG: AraC family transcriptional [Prolixibacteraceae bacterium]
MKEIRYFKIPVSLIEGQKANPLTSNLYLTEIGEIEVECGTIWSPVKKLENNMLVFCTKGSGIVMISGEQIPVSGEQFFIIPKQNSFKFYSVIDVNSRFLVIHYDGRNSQLMGKEFSVARNLIPSVNNLVANREILFDEIFNNLSKGFHDENLEYVNFCFGHLLATFIYASKTSDDLADESNPGIRRSIDFMNRNLGEKLTLGQISKEAGYSPTYFTTLFKKETNYPPLSYFSHLKIVKACEFLDYTQIKVKEISFTLGFTDPYYFTKDFKKKMGMPPRQYRNRVGK